MGRVPRAWLFVGLIVLVPQASGQSFRNLTQLMGGNAAMPYTVLPYGAAVAGRWTVAPQSAFRWVPQYAASPLPGLPGWTYGLPEGMSGDGSVVVGNYLTDADPSNDEHAFYWSCETGTQELPGTMFHAFAVSNDGRYIVGDYPAIDNRACVWSMESGVVDLDPSGQWSASVAWGVNGDGSAVVGKAVGASGAQAFRWTAATGIVGLGDLTGNATNLDSEAEAVSLDGSVVIGTAAITVGFRHAFRWTAEGGMESLDDRPTGNSFAYSMSGDGQIIIGERDGVSFVWDGTHGMQTAIEALTNYGMAALIAGWNIQSVDAISWDGTALMGSGIAPGGQPSTWLAVLVDAVPGDANADRKVTGADYTIWADNFGGGMCVKTLLQGDFNLDAQVTGADYTIWADNYGAMTAATAVPEPTGLRVLAPMLVAAIVMGRCMSRSERWTPWRRPNEFQLPNV